MFHEVLVIPYIKICEFSAFVSQGYIVLECSFGLGRETNTNHSRKEITLIKASQTVQVALLENIQLSIRLS